MTLEVIDNSWMEGIEERTARLDFEASHSFKVGDRVYLTNDFWKGWDVVKQYFSTTEVWIVTRVKTSVSTGACLRIESGGVELNVFSPNEDLFKCDEITDLLYE